MSLVVKKNLMDPRGIEPGMSRWESEVITTTLWQERDVVMTKIEYTFMVVYQFKFWREKFKIVSQPEPELSLPKWSNLDTMILL